MTGRADTKFSIIQDTLYHEQNMLSISTLCDLAGVSRSGYYRWLSAAKTRRMREEQDEADFALIVEAYSFRGYAKGARGIHMRLLHHDPPIIMNLKKIRRLMDKFHLKCPIRKANPYRRMARALRTSNVAPNLLQREFREHGPRMVLLTDITYVLFGTASRCYLSTILDAYTRQILSYVLGESLELDFVLETVEKLITEHGISLHAETLINSDQGCHYTSYRFIQIIRDANLRQSMSRKANCWDNAPQESFYGHMKDEIDLHACTTFDQVKSRIDDWTHYYNHDRCQWDLARLTPNEFYDYCLSGIYPLPLPAPSLPPR